MDRRYQLPRSHLFTVRLWEEEVGLGQNEWRGKVQLVSSGDVRYFRRWSALTPLLVTMLSEMGSQVDAARETCTGEE
jgi:hypothetical protein